MMSHLQRSARRTVAGFAAASAGMAAVAVAFAGSAGAGDLPDYELVQGNNPTCGDQGYDIEFKIDDIDELPAEGTYDSSHEDVEVTGDVGDFEVAITNVGVTTGNAYFTFNSNQPVDAVLVKAGSDNHRFYEFDGGSTMEWLMSERDSISHISFCWDDDSTTTTTRPDDTTTTTAPDDTTTTTEPDDSTTTTQPDDTATTTVPEDEGDEEDGEPPETPAAAESAVTGTPNLTG